MKKNALLSSILVVALCFSLIAGSTFALFTDEHFVTIDVDAGQVKIEASLTTPELYSVVPAAEAGSNPVTEYDEHGKAYAYVPQEDGKFANGGTATINDTNGVITLENITPGDKIVFGLNATNSSDVAIQYRYRVEVISGFDLMVGCIITVAGEKLPSLAAYSSTWEPLSVGQNINTVQLALELPVSAGNEYQNGSAQIKVYVEAVQDNADVSDTDAVSKKYITTATNAVELAQKLADDENLHVFVNSDIDTVLDIDFDMTDKTIDANGNSVALKFAGTTADPVTLENVVIKNIVDTPDEVPAITFDNTVVGDVTILNCDLYSGAGAPNGAIAGEYSNTSLNLTVEKSRLLSGAGELDENGVPLTYANEYGLYLTGAANVVIRDTEFIGFGAWAIKVNSETVGNIVVSGCTFTDCAGILSFHKVGQAGSNTGSLNGNLTFANNKMYNCTAKNGQYMYAYGVYGTITFSNNTMNDVVVTIDDMKCDYLTNKYDEQLF